MQKKNYQEEILNLIHSGLPQQELAERLSDYHENDLADALAVVFKKNRSLSNSLGFGIYLFLFIGFILKPAK